MPDLDVNGVIQNTLEELFQTYVKEKFIINNSLNIIKAKDEVAHFKISMKLKTEIDNYFSNLKVIPDEDLIIHNVKIIDKAIINNIYVELDHNLFTSIKSRVDRLILLLNKYINDNINTISRKFIINKVSQKELNEFKNNLNNHLKKYFTVMNIKIKKIYSEILEKNNIDTSELDKNIINIEDIPALTYINYKLYGSREFDNYKHIVIDEAQDYGEFTFYVLNKIFRNATFSIYGDLAQSLYPYRSLKNWKCLENIFEKLEILKLNKSYRTTIEIMNEANKINELLKLDQAIPVIRHGEEVEYFDTDLKDLLQQLKDKYQTIAIITKDQEKANFLYEELNSKLEVILITKDNLDYEGNITVLPSYLAKGLEFDCVIIMNENDFNIMYAFLVDKSSINSKIFVSVLNYNNDDTTSTRTETFFVKDLINTNNTGFTLATVLIDGFSVKIPMCVVDDTEQFVTGIDCTGNIYLSNGQLDLSQFKVMAQVYKEPEQIEITNIETPHYKNRAPKVMESYYGSCFAIVDIYGARLKFPINTFYLDPDIR